MAANADGVAVLFSWSRFQRPLMESELPPAAAVYLNRASSCDLHSVRTGCTGCICGKRNVFAQTVDDGVLDRAIERRFVGDELDNRVAIEASARAAELEEIHGKQLFELSCEH